jgi:hypothetical protein
MTRTKLILASLLGGAMAFGVACSSDKAAQRSADPAVIQNPADTGGSGQFDEQDVQQDEHVPQEDRLGTGGTGYEEDYPKGDDPVMPEDPGVGGAGLEEDVPETLDDPSFEGDLNNPSDEVIPE